VWARGVPGSAKVRLRRRGLPGAAAALLAAAAILEGCGNASKPQPPPNASTLIGAGTVLFKQGNYDAATQLFQQALSLDPGNALAHYDLGTTYEAENRVDLARAQYQKAIAGDPSMVSAMYNEATLDAAGDPAMAVFLYRRVVAMKPDSPTAYLNLGLIEHDQGLRTQAGADLRKAVQLDPSLRAQIPSAEISDLSLPAPKHYSPAGGPHPQG
jgi:tetratricopeptide (TPR) repeat protein